MIMCGDKHHTMGDVRYEETEDTAILRTERDTEWVESDSVVRLADWR